MTAKTSFRLKTWFGFFPLLALILPNALFAADLPSQGKAPMYAPLSVPIFSWTGVYAGANLGGGFSTGNAFNGYLGTSSGKASGVAGGGQIGYNFQISPMLVVGIENDFMAGGISTGSGSNPYVKMPFFGSGRARAGLALLDSRLLLYGTAGVAVGQIQDMGVKNLRYGFTAGGGAEWAFSDRWSVKMEGLYTDLSKGSDSSAWSGRHAKFISARVGLNYHFDLLRSSRFADGY